MFRGMLKLASAKIREGLVVELLPVAHDSIRVIENNRHVVTFNFLVSESSRLASLFYLVAPNTTPIITLHIIGNSYEFVDLSFGHSD